MEAKRIILKKPIILGEREIKELCFNVEPKVKHLRGIKLTEVSTDSIILVAGRLCNQPPAVMGEVHFTDIKQVVEVVTPFLEDFLEIFQK